VRVTLYLILLAFTTGNSSLEPLLEGLFAQISIYNDFGRNRTGDLRINQTCSVQRGFLPELNRGPADDPSPALFSTELW